MGSFREVEERKKEGREKKKKKKKKKRSTTSTLIMPGEVIAFTPRFSQAHSIKVSKSYVKLVYFNSI